MRLAKRFADCSIVTGGILIVLYGSVALLPTRPMSARAPELLSKITNNAPVEARIVSVEKFVWEHAVVDERRFTSIEAKMEHLTALYETAAGRLWAILLGIILMVAERVYTHIASMLNHHRIKR